MERFIDPERALKYDYKSINNSIADKYILRYWWPIAIRAIPARMSANLVSILGNWGSWAAFLILIGVFGPIGKIGREKPWIFGLVALFYFFYQTMDALDGIQARRTGAAGPLGEFVDHWFDSFNVFLLPLGILCAFPVFPPLVSIATVFVYIASDWFILREIRNGGILVFDPVSTEEAQVLTQVFFLAVWFLGYDFWIRPFFFGLSPIMVLFGISFISLFFVSVGAALRAGGLGLFAIVVASLLPILLWAALAEARLGSSALVFGGLLIGFAGSRFSGEVLRERLIGTQYPVFFIDVIVMDAFLLSSALIPGLPVWVCFAAAVAALLWTFICLAYQFRLTIVRVKKLRGTGLFDRSALPRA